MPCDRSPSLPVRSTRQVVPSHSSPPGSGAGSSLNAVVVVVYLVNRTACDVIGPMPHAVEPAGSAPSTSRQGLVDGGAASGPLIICLLRARRTRFHHAMQTTTSVKVAELMSASG
jgi:hypothetical protein